MSKRKCTFSSSRSKQTRSSGPAVKSNGHLRTFHDHTARLCFALVCRQVDEIDQLKVEFFCRMHDLHRLAIDLYEGRAERFVPARDFSECLSQHAEVSLP